MKRIIGIIPARFGSTRFPGKPLIQIQGKSMIQRVYEQARKSACLQQVCVATDHEEIARHVHSFGGNVVLTSTEHHSGTDRCYEALIKTGETFSHLINIQGDEPFIDPSQIDVLAGLCAGETEIGTLMIPVHSEEILFDPGEVKIVCTSAMEALYFSREVIPHLKGLDRKIWHAHHPYFRHVGMYAYRSDILKKIVDLPPSQLESAESLEQLRWLEAGYKIKLAITEHDSHCIDTPEDIEKVMRRMGMGKD